MKKRFNSALFFASIILIIIGNKNVQAAVYNSGSLTKVTYSAHVQDIGWQSGVSNGDVAGTVGKDKNLEAFRIQSDSSAPFYIEYTSEINNENWQPAVKDGDVSGTIGQNKAVSNVCIAIKDKETGLDSTDYDIYYKVQVKNSGWLNWSKEGMSANSTDNLIEALRVEIVKKGDKPIESAATDVWYKSHVQGIGWQSDVVNGALSGTTGQAKSMEAIQAAVNPSAPYSIQYTAHINGRGWTSTKHQGETAGTVGEGIAINNLCIAIKDKDTNSDSSDFDIYYRVQVSNQGWRGWVKNGTCVNDTTNNIEAIKILILKKGEQPPADKVVDVKQQQREAVVNEAKKYLGVKYVYGGTTPSGFDCSGLTQYVYRRALGIDITRTTHTQVNQGIAVSASNLQAGDLIFTSAGHVQLYIGNGQVIHAPQTGEVVKIANLKTVWKARRIIY